MASSSSAFASEVKEQVASAQAAAGSHDAGAFGTPMELNPPRLFFRSRRSPVLATKGAVASSQSLASQIGLDILKAGGNAADACIATAAALNVTEPCSTGIGGDMFCLYFDAASGKVSAINGTGRAPAALTREVAVATAEAAAAAGGGDQSADKLPNFHPHTVTVPGAAAGWVDTFEKFGSGNLTLAQILQPAIDLADNGFPVHPVAASLWSSARAEDQLKSGNEMLVDGKRAPAAGEVFCNPNLASTFRELAEKGKDGFYKGRIAQAIVDTLAAEGGVMTLEDLAAHVSTFPEPITTNYHGVDVWEIPPNSQAITALMALNVLEDLNIAEKYEHNSADHLHAVIEALRLSFADTRWYVTDPEFENIPVKELISKEYARARREAHFDHSKASLDLEHGSPVVSACTVSFCAVDSQGNACSYIVSNYMGFGTGINPRGTGFTLQNRGANFSLQEGHPNVIKPGKRPYHTLCPGMATIGKQLYCPFSVMGGFNQVQGHVQVLMNMIDWKMDSQTALDAPRVCIENGEAGGHVCVEEGIAEDVIAELRARGHPVQERASYARSVFGRGQIIRRHLDSGVLCAGSDGRGDGCAAGWS